MLYLIATPIGNLEDITFRAVRILGEVDLIAAEDTRHTQKLLNHYEIKTPLISFHEYSDERRIDELIHHMGNGTVALVSDAGTPLISDPGYRLVQAAINMGIDVVPIPGPSAAITALAASGLPTDRFLFLGFPPKQKKKRDQLFAEVEAERGTLIFYESPHRLVSFLKDAQQSLGDRPVVICRELTKRYEEFWRGPMSEGVQVFEERGVKGEVTLLISGKVIEKKEWSDQDLLNALAESIGAGKSLKGAVAEITGISGRRKRDVYQLALSIQNRL
ncbi:MAG: 16S rRNA (cytidine(1402)-2'-O)-methyltransferase [Chloroflexota bacterium]